MREILGGIFWLVVSLAFFITFGIGVSSIIKNPKCPFAFLSFMPLLFNFMIAMFFAWCGIMIIWK